MKDGRARLLAREPLLALLGVVVAIAYQATWYLAPGLLRMPAVPGSAIPFSYALFIISIVGPIILAWFCMQSDKQDSQQ